MDGAFDLNAARKSGASDEQIAQFLGQQYNYDVNAAIKAGATASQVAEHLAKNPTPPQAKSAKGYGTEMAENFLPDFWTLMKEFGSTIRHPIQSVKAIAAPIKGGFETGLQALGVNQGKPQTEEQAAFRQFAQPLVKSFEDPLGVPKRVLEYTAEKPAHQLMNLSMLMGGAGKLAKSPGLSEVGAALDPMNIATKTVAGAAKPLGYLGRQAVGFTTGKRFPIVNEMYKTLKTGGDAADTALKYLRGKLEAEDAIGVYKGALKTIRDDQLASYTSQLKALDNNPIAAIDITALRNELTKKLYDYDVRIGKKGQLDFSRSKAFAADLQGQADVKQITEIIRGWGSKAGDNTPVMLDTLRGILQDFYSPSSKSREFATTLKNVVKDKISDKVPEYRTMLEQYEKRQEIFEESKKLFSMKNPNDRRVNADLVLKKLQRAMTEDSEFARDFIAKVEQESGKDVMSTIAAHSMNPALPGGIVGRGMLGGSLYETARTGIAGFDPHLALMMGAASPRATGEFLNVVAKTARGAGAARQAVKATTGARQAVTLTGIAAKKEQERTGR